MTRLALVITMLLALFIASGASAHYDEISKASTCQAWQIDGHQHSDRIIGSSVCARDDVFRGLYDDDELWGNGGDDELRGGRGRDEIHGSTGNDLIYGNEEPDLLYGGFGNDVIYGGSGADHIDCGDGIDYAYGGGGDDTFAHCDGNAVE